MPSRLDLQKSPSKLHARVARKTVKGYKSTPRSQWGDALNVQAAPSMVLSDVDTITASDAPNAAKLAGLGYTAYPTSNWTTGQRITINGFTFNWTGAAWAAGIHA
jgi:hypothetical protein